MIRRLTDGEVQRTVSLAGGLPGFQSFALTGDGEAIAAVLDTSTRRPGQNGNGTGELVRYSVVNGDILARAGRVHTDDVTRIVPVPGRSFVLTASWDGRILAVDRKTLHVVHTYFHTNKQINDLAISPDGRRFAGVWTYEEDGSGTVGVWDIDQEAPIWRGRGPEGFNAVVWTADGSSLIAAGNGVSELNAGTGQPFATTAA